jgi:hypothetical protein
MQNLRKRFTAVMKPGGKPSANDERTPRDGDACMAYMSAPDRAGGPPLDRFRPGPLRAKEVAYWSDGK